MDIGRTGSESDDGVFDESLFKVAVEDGTLNMPNAKSRSSSSQ